MTEGRAQTHTQRAHATHTPKWQRFQTTISSHGAATSSGKPANAIAAKGPAAAFTHPYMRQYSHVYHHRLTALKIRCMDAYHLSRSSDSDEQQPKIKQISRILELQESVPSVVVGTLVREKSDESSPDSITGTTILVLEDESGRVTLKVDRPNQWCTGMVVAAQGKVLPDTVGVFQVDRFFAPAPVSNAVVQGDLVGSEANDASTNSGASSSPHVLILSGLNCGAPDVSSLPRDMLLSYLQGQFNPTEEDTASTTVTATASKICRVVIAGGACTPSSEGVQELDGWLAQVCSSGIPVDLIPGKDDPTTANWPQRPFHSSLLPHSSSVVQTAQSAQSSMIHKTPNPYAAGMGDKLLMGTDGTNVQDLARVLESSLSTRMDDNDNDDSTTQISELEAARTTLTFSHMCPTGPDSVPTVPHAQQDPMVITEMPHIYFAGNSSSFDTTLHQVERKIGSNDETTTELVQTRIICVPKFSDTKEVVLVNLETLDCELLRFDDEL